MLQGKLPFAGSDWAPTQPVDTTDEGKETDTSQEQQQQTSSGTLTQDEVSTREDTDTTDTTNDKSVAANTEESVENSAISDEDTAIFGADQPSSTKREELLKAVFEDNNITTGSQVQDTRQGDTVTNSHYDPDDWVNVPNDELI